jgi:hypothetical protein
LRLQLRHANQIPAAAASACQPLPNLNAGQFMLMLVIKYAVTALVIVLVSEVSKRSDKAGALISALPFVTIMVMIWLYLERQGSQKIGNHAYYTFWYVLPTMPMFLVMPWLMAKGVNFWIALVICAAVTLVSFVITAMVAKRLGVHLMP